LVAVFVVVDDDEALSCATDAAAADDDDDDEEEEEEEILVREETAFAFTGRDARSDEVASCPPMDDIAEASNSFGRTLHSFALTISCAIGSSKSVTLKGITQPRPLSSTCRLKAAMSAGEKDRPDIELER
jgi:hypothetical protein